MSGRSGRKGKKAAAESIRDWLRTLMDYFICVYMFMILAVLPFYFENGYSYIATEKGLFFRRLGVCMGKVMWPLLTLWLVCSAVAYFRRAEKPAFNKACKKLWSEISMRISAVDCFAAIYGLALLLSYFFSAYREQALWGAEGWHMGLCTQLILLGTYFLIAKLWRPRRVFFYIMLAASAVVFLLGYLNRFGVYPIEMERSSPSFISTIGNINWYCGYGVTAFFGGMALLWQKRGRGNGVLAAYAALGFATLVTQGSASGIVTLLVMMLVFYVLSARDDQAGRPVKGQQTAAGMRQFWGLAVLLWGACLITGLLRTVFPGRMNYSDRLVDLFTSLGFSMVMTIVSVLCLIWVDAREKKGTYGNKIARISAILIVTSLSLFAGTIIVLIVANTVSPGSIGALSKYEFFTFSDGWGSNRGVTWKTGIKCFLEQDFLHKLVGVGPDAMKAYIYSDGSPELVEPLRRVFGSYYLTNAHNEWLTVLADTGILGLAGFGGMMASAAGSMIGKTGRKAIASACGFSLLAYTVNNIFSFQQVMNTSTAFVILGMGAAFLSAESKGDSRV